MDVDLIILFDTNFSTLMMRSTSSLKITNRCFRYSAPYLWNQLPDSFREPHPHLSIFDSQSHYLVIPDHRFHQCHHCHHLSPLLSFTPDSKHTSFTNRSHHSLLIIDHPWTDFTVTRPAHWFYLAKRSRSSRQL